jgi:hypothetical protein
MPGVCSLSLSLNFLESPSWEYSQQYVKDVTHLVAFLPSLHIKVDHRTSENICIIELLLPILLPLLLLFYSFSLRQNIIELLCHYI